MPEKLHLLVTGVTVVNQGLNAEMSFVDFLDFLSYL